MKATMLWTDAKGRPVEVVPVGAKAVGRWVFVSIVRKDPKPQPEPFWVLCKSLWLVPGRFTDFMVAMRDVPGWVEDKCEAKVLEAVKIVAVNRAREGRRGKDSALVARTGSGRGGREGRADARPTR